jgi:hypothetical protein
MDNHDDTTRSIVLLLGGTLFGFSAARFVLTHDPVFLLTGLGGVVLWLSGFLVGKKGNGE